MSSYCANYKIDLKIHFTFFEPILKFRDISRSIYIPALEGSCYSLSENGIVYYATTYYFGDISV